MNSNLRKITGLLGMAAMTFVCSPTQTEREQERSTLPPEPVVTYTATDAEAGTFLLSPQAE